MKTKEEILKNTIDKSDWLFSPEGRKGKVILEAMEEYAKQFKPVKRKPFMSTAILRLIVLPLMASIFLIASLRFWIILCKNFIIYGGEAVTYTKDMSPESIGSILHDLTKKK